MSLIRRHPPTERELAARRANARLSSGPRTERGKRHTRLNALRHGRYAQDFRRHLVEIGVDLWLFDWILARLWDHFQPWGSRARIETELMAREIWCRAWRDARVHRLGGFSRDGRMSKALLKCLGGDPLLEESVKSDPRSPLQSVVTFTTSRSPSRSRRSPRKPQASAMPPVSTGGAPPTDAGESVTATTPWPLPKLGGEQSHTPS